eukprot:2893164-Rhodomonas_salina.2
MESTSSQKRCYSAPSSPHVLRRYWDTHTSEFCHRSSQVGAFSPSKRLRLESDQDEQPEKVGGVFATSLRGAGICFDDTGPILTASSAKVRYSLEKALQFNSTSPSEFLEGLEE